MSEAKPRWLRIGSVRSGKDGKDTYIKIGFPKNKDGTPVATEITLKEGQVVRVQDPRKNPKLPKEMLEKIPAYVKFELVLPPDQT